MDFEFDPSKSSSNLAKHGIDFEKAQALWLDPDLIEIPARTVGESRYLVVGKVGKRHWAGIITYRGKRIRIISVRRATQQEVRIYEASKGTGN